MQYDVISKPQLQGTAYVNSLQYKTIKLFLPLDVLNGKFA